MENNAKTSSFRYLELVLGTAILLVLGSLYAWSTYRGTLVEEFNWSVSSAQLTFSISMMTFCLGGLFSGIVSKKTGPRPMLIISAVLMFAGLMMASKISSLTGLYVSYGVLYGFGVGVGYNGVMGTIVKWFPDKTGLCSGILLMGFGISSLIVGRVGAGMLNSIGWRSTFTYFGIVFGIIVLIIAFFVRPPKPEETAGLQVVSKKSEPFSEQDYKGMLRSASFWLYFIWTIVLSAAGLVIVGNSAPFANTITGSLETAATVAGIISVCNGVGRVIFGGMFDKAGYRKTMLTVVILFVISTVILILANHSGSFAVLLVAYILVGLAYGGVTPTNSAFVAKFFGNKNYPLNLSIVNLCLLVASYLPQVATILLDRTGNYDGAFYYMIVLAVIALVLTFLIRAPKQEQ